MPLKPGLIRAIAEEVFSRAMDPVSHKAIFMRSMKMARRFIFGEAWTGKAAFNGSNVDFTVDFDALPESDGFDSDGLQGKAVVDGETETEAAPDSDSDQMVEEADLDETRSGVRFSV